jgi:hypothetical protein
VDIAWSTETVAADTRSRARDLGLELVELPTWYDVDDAGSFHRLLDALFGEAPAQAGALVPFDAPSTAACLTAMGFAAAGAAKKFA